MIGSVVVCVLFFFFFFQAEDGIRDKLVTGVQTCALPIWGGRARRRRGDRRRAARGPPGTSRRPARRPLPLCPALPLAGGAGPCRAAAQIGRASCRERV